MSNLLFTFVLMSFVLLISTNEPAQDQSIYLPLVFKAEALTPSQEVSLQITPSGHLFSSTFEPHSFILTNKAANSQAITHVTIDLSTTIFPDMVYDPNGIAGDQTAKNLQVDSNGALVGFLGHSFNGPHDDGFDQLNIAFAHFDPGETFSFSIDVDPTSIRGVAAPGPHQSGSVSGLELVGATVTVTFADASMISGQAYRLPHSVGGSEAVLRSNLPPAPQVQVEGVSGATAVVTESSQTVVIETVTRGLVKVLLIEGGLFTDGVPNGGHDLDPFEANSALSVREYEIFATSGGVVNVPVLLNRTHENGGINHIIVVQENGFGYKGSASSPVILELQD